MKNGLKLTFDTGQTALAIRVEQQAELPNAFKQIGLSDSRPVLVVVGGASNISEAEFLRIQRLFVEVLAPIAENLGAYVVDGGTDGGPMRLMGEARNQIGAKFTLIGVTPESKVTLPNQLEVAADLTPLEPNHTHFVLVPGNNWGDESPWISDVATVLSCSAPSLTVLLNGGEITFKDAFSSVNTGRLVLVIAGSGRTADILAAALGGDAFVSQLVVEQGSLSSYDTRLLNDVGKQKTQREIDKLTAEIRQIRSETAGSLFWVKLLGVFVTVGGAVGGYVLAQKETNQDRLKFETDKEQKRLDFEHRKDVDTAYQGIIQELTTPERPLLRAAAAMKLGSLLQEFPSEWNVPEYRKKQLIHLTKQILVVALINESEPKVRKVLTTSLAQDSNLQELDLSEVQAANAYWAKIDFTGTDFFKANLSCTSFRKAKLCGVQFRSANLQEAVLAEANCTETNFKLADLSRANLSNTNMAGAILVDANLEEADLLRAYNLSVEQIKAAKNWELAHYDRELRVQLGLDS